MRCIINVTLRHKRKGPGFCAVTNHWLHVVSNRPIKIERL
jgi:hypothetical protein